MKKERKREKKIKKEQEPELEPESSKRWNVITTGFKDFYPATYVARFAYP